MKSTLYCAIDLIAQPEDWKMNPPLYRTFQFITGSVLCLLSMHLWIRIKLHLRRGLARPEIGIIIDSGAATHTCHDRSKLRNYKAFYIPQAMRGIGGTSWGLGIGDMEIVTKLKYGNNPNRQETLYLYGVLYMPDSGVTLLSTGQLQLEGIFYSSEKGILYRNGKNCDVIVGETESYGHCPKLKTVEERPTEGTPCSPHSSWFDIQNWFVLPSVSFPYVPSWCLCIQCWCSQHLSGTMHGVDEGRISQLEIDHDRLLSKVASQMQEIARLKHSPGHNEPITTRQAAFGEPDLATRLIDYAQAQSLKDTDVSSDRLGEVKKTKVA